MHPNSEDWPASTADEHDPPSRPTDPVAAALHNSSEALRLANLATRHGLVDVIEVYDALGTVTTLVDRLPPIVLFTRRCALDRGTGGLRDDSGRDPGERLLEFVAVLTLAHTALIGAARALGRGHAALSHLRHRPTHT